MQKKQEKNNVRAGRPVMVSIDVHRKLKIEAAKANLSMCKFISSLLDNVSMVQR